jgi:hypothetical protein
VRAWHDVVVERGTWACSGGGRLVILTGESRSRSVGGSESGSMDGSGSGSVGGSRGGSISGSRSGSIVVAGVEA